MEELDIITLDNDKEYTIYKKLTYNNREFLLLIEVDQEENIKDDKIILEIIKINNEYELQEVEDEELYKYLSKKFIEMIMNDL